VTTLISGGTVLQKRARGSTAGAFSPSRALSEAVALQRDRWVLWLPVAMIAGAALWLLAPADPPSWIAPALLVVGAVAALVLGTWPSQRADGWRVRLRQVLAGLCALTAAAGLGGGAAQLRALSVMQPAFTADETPRLVEGWVVANDASDSGPRLRLLVRAVEGVAGPPRYVRVSVPQAGLLTPGRAARCRAVLGAPAGPMAARRV
jgi:competence protein ComEC